MPVRNMGQVDAVIFDLDGTLVDTSPHTIACIEHSLEQIGQDFDIKQIMAAIGSPSLEEVFRFILGSPKESLVDQCVWAYRSFQREHLEEGLNSVRLYPGVKETLKLLTGFKFGVITGKPHWLADRILAAKGIGQFFSSLVGVDDVVHNKPCPDMIQLASSQLGCPQRRLIVGDSIVDIQAGRNAQILTCAVEYGYTRRDKLLELNPDFLVSEFPELIQIL